MAAYLDPETFILADDLLREIMGALATGHATLATKSRSPAGTLVVKEAEITIAFDFSVRARETRDGLGLSVRPPHGGGFFLIPALEASAASTRIDVVNRATVTVRIVNVLPLEEATLADKERLPKEQPPAHRPPKEREPSLSDEQVPKIVRSVLTYLATGVPEAAKVLAARAHEIERLLAEGAREKAQRVAVAFADEVRQVVAAQEVEVPKGVDDALARLEQWADGATPAADALRVYDRRRIEALAPLLARAGVKRAAHRAFARRAQGALEVGRTTTAQALLATALRDLEPDLRGVVLAPEFYDLLEKLDLRGVLEQTDGAWRAPFEASVAQLGALVASLDLPRRPAAAFDKGIAEVLASQSASEAGSRLLTVFEVLRAETATLALPPSVRETLDKLSRTAPS